MLDILPALCLINARLCSRFDICWSWMGIRIKDTREMVSGVSVMIQPCLIVRLYLLSPRGCIALSAQTALCMHCGEFILICSWVCSLSLFASATLSFSPICSSLTFFFLCFVSPVRSPTTQQQCEMFSTWHTAYLTGVTTGEDNCWLQPGNTARNRPITALHTSI